MIRSAVHQFRRRRPDAANVSRLLSSANTSFSWELQPQDSVCSDNGRCHEKALRRVSSLLSYATTSHASSSLNHRQLSTRCFSSTAPNTDSDDSDSDTPESFTIGHRPGVRNVAIIAHVDHGKTTLVDKLLATTQAADGLSDRLMDSGELEQERGITITSKVTRLTYNSSSTDDTITINCVDTPGHADFSGEVDRILSMVDGVCLLVDAGEGPMTQTKYVLSRSLALGLKPLVVLNKVDRPNAIARLESGETESDLLDLFDALGATDEQMDYPTLYGSAREGWMTDDLDTAYQLASGKVQPSESTSMKVLLDAMLGHVPEPAIRQYETTAADEVQPFALAAVTVGMDTYMGRTCTGRIVSGSIALNDKVQVIPREGPMENTDATTLGGICVNRGISRTPLEDGMAHAGDIVTLVGVPEHMAVGDTVTGAENPVKQPIETPPVAPPTLSMEFGANTGPLSGMEGTIVTSSKVRDRLFQETDNNVTLSVAKSETDSEKTVVLARGELQLGILAEQMRREGFELMISPPRILMKECPDTKKKLEPFEEVIVDVDSEFSGTVVSSLTGDRKGILMEMTENADGKTRLMFEVPSRGLLGFSSEIATATKGTAVVNHCYLEDRLYAGQLGLDSSRSKIVSMVQGKATAFSLGNLAQRGTLFIEPGDMVYQGMVIGESAKSRDIDMDVNPVKAKDLTNMRTQAKDEKIVLPPPKRLSVEELIGYMSQDEIIEVTPDNVRLRKAELDPNVRARAKKGKKNKK
ncbi:factor TypA-like SVR3, chloroplastic [Seminavis robusta]|uniref:Factor TypA-like SVR3, chloroplastic n=1 Tax=Seminavis robusta TaxID=568900 RepID=A0A9N8GZL3_9STRA|nr:factor TypA-like SVR3, chloroplastic [Seminavis robusta]|eukprot:Sro5_g004520.1 factor TypA-like SVR3, chloroplastic (754) ;mRNA; r:175434-177827